MCLLLIDEVNPFDDMLMEGKVGVGRGVGGEKREKYSISMNEYIIKMEII